MLNYCSQRTAECFVFLHRLHLLVNSTFTGKMSNTEFFSFFFFCNDLFTNCIIMWIHTSEVQILHALLFNVPASVSRERDGPRLWRRLTLPAQTRFPSLRLVNQVTQQHSCVSPTTHCVACYGLEVCSSIVHESRQTASVEHMLPGGQEIYVRV